MDGGQIRSMDLDVIYDCILFDGHPLHCHRMLDGILRSKITNAGEQIGSGAHYDGSKVHIRGATR